MGLSHLHEIERIPRGLAAAILAMIFGLGWSSVDAQEPAAEADAAPAAEPRATPVVTTENAVIAATLREVPVPPPAPATEVVRRLICPPNLIVFGRCPVLPGSPIIGTRINVRH
jgi:hypothetical protein